MVWRKACTRPSNGEALDFTAWGDGGIQHWIILPGTGLTIVSGLTDSSCLGQQEWLGWSLEASISPILSCLTTVISFCPFCPIKIMTILLITVQLKLLYFSMLYLNCTKIKPLLSTNLPAFQWDLMTLYWFMLYLYCRKDLQQDTYRKSICRRIL